MKKYIALDICNTIADVNRQIDKITGVKRGSGLYYHPATCPEWFLTHLEVFSDCSAIKNSVKVINKLAEVYGIVYSSARPNEAYSLTEHWLLENMYPKGEIVFTDNKVVVAKEYDIAFAIEDAPHEIKSYLDNGINVFTKAQDYNLSFPQRFEWSNFLELYHSDICAT